MAGMVPPKSAGNCASTFGCNVRSLNFKKSPGLTRAATTSPPLVCMPWNHVTRTSRPLLAIAGCASDGKLNVLDASVVSRERKSRAKLLGAGIRQGPTQNPQPGPFPQVNALLATPWLPTSCGKSVPIAMSLAAMLLSEALNVPSFDNFQRLPSAEIHVLSPFVRTMAGEVDVAAEERTIGGDGVNA